LLFPFLSDEFTYYKENIQEFTPSDVDIVDNFITVPNIEEFTEGDEIKFRTDDTLPSPLVTGIIYTISSIIDDKIQLEGITLTSIGVGNHTIIINDEYSLLPKLGPDIDYSDLNDDYSELNDYRFGKLIDPVNEIEFVVPNNVHGGKTGEDLTLNYFHPHMWRVFWHIRPAVSVMKGTDIPSKTARTGGVMADPVLNSMYEYPDIENITYHVPDHRDMSIDWLDTP